MIAVAIACRRRARGSEFESLHAEHVFLVQLQTSPAMHRIPDGHSMSATSRTASCDIARSDVRREHSGIQPAFQFRFPRLVTRVSEQFEIRSMHRFLAVHR